MKQSFVDFWVSFFFNFFAKENSKFNYTSILFFELLLIVVNSSNNRIWKLFGEENFPSKDKGTIPFYDSMEKRFSRISIDRIDRRSCFFRRTIIIRLIRNDIRNCLNFTGTKTFPNYRSTNIIDWIRTPTNSNFFSINRYRINRCTRRFSIFSRSICFDKIIRIAVLVRIIKTREEKNFKIHSSQIWKETRTIKLLLGYETCKLCKIDFTNIYIYKEHWRYQKKKEKK